MAVDTRAVFEAGGRSEGNRPTPDRAADERIEAQAGGTAALDQAGPVTHSTTQRLCWTEVVDAQALGAAARADGPVP